MPYSEQIIRTRGCDMGGHRKPSSILESMQEAAIANCVPPISCDQFWTPSGSHEFCLAALLR